MTMKRPDEAFIDLLKRSGSSEKNEALAAQRELAKAIELPLREGVLVGNILDGIFEAIPMEPGTTTEFPLDLSPTPIPDTDVFPNALLKAITSWFQLTASLLQSTTCCVTHEKLVGML